MLPHANRSSIEICDGLKSVLNDCSDVGFGVKLQIVSINMPRKIHLITFIPSSHMSTILLQLIIHLSPSKIFICVLHVYEKRCYEEDGSCYEVPHNKYLTLEICGIKRPFV